MYFNILSLTHKKSTTLPFVVSLWDAAIEICAVVHFIIFFFGVRYFTSTVHSLSFILFSYFSGDFYEIKTQHFLYSLFSFIGVSTLFSFYPVFFCIIIIFKSTLIIFDFIEIEITYPHFCICWQKSNFGVSDVRHAVAMQLTVE